MNMRERSTLQECLSRHRALLGLLQMRLNPLLAETAGQCGYDFLLLDCEHGVFSESDFSQSLKTLAATDVLALVRLAAHDTQALSRYLDMGADAIVVPHVSTAEEARRLARAIGPHKQASLIVIIESALGVASADEILAIEGVDGAIVGPNDLTTDLGSKGDYSQPAYAQALLHIERAAAAAGKLLGTIPHAGYPLEALLARGHRLLILGSDSSLMREAMSAQVAKARSCL